MSPNHPCFVLFCSWIIIRVTLAGEVHKLLSRPTRPHLCIFLYVLLHRHRSCCFRSTCLLYTPCIFHRNRPHNIQSDWVHIHRIWQSRITVLQHNRWPSTVRSPVQSVAARKLSQHSEWIYRKHYWTIQLSWISSSSLTDLVLQKKYVTPIVLLVLIQTCCWKTAHLLERT